MQQPPPTPCSPRQAAAAAKSPTASFSSPSSSSVARVQQQQQHQHMAQTTNKPITKPIKTATMGDAVRPKSLAISSSSTNRKATTTTYSSAAATAVHSSLPPGDIFRNIDDVVSYFDKFLDLPSMYSSHRCTSNSASSLPIAGACAQHHHQHNRNLIITTLCANLKIYGPQLEQVCKDVLDRVFVCLRQSSIIDDDDEELSLDAITRLSLLQVIELRAAGWSQPPNESTVMSYYSNKLRTLQLQAISDGNGRSTATTQRTWPDADLLANHQTITTSTPLSPTAAAAADDDDAGQQLPLLLEPGQVVKSTGKYGDACYIAASSSASSSSRIGQQQQASDVTTTNNNNSNNNNRLSGLSIYKDEVVIRNSDSGKVMGIKGKRVHLIEEISDTVISFQRVNPGAKERLVQITGAHLGNIRTAKQLIEQTIQRNQSPTPPPPSTSSLISSFVIAGAGAGVMDNNNTTKKTAAAAADAVESTSSSRVTASRCDDGVEVDACTVLGDYQHTVTAMGGNSITISGKNLPLVEMAKLVLDEYFKGAVTNTNFNLSSSYDERNCNNNMTILSSSHRLKTTNDPPAIISAAAAANGLCSAVMAAVYEPCTLTVGGSSSSSSIETVNGIEGGGGDGEHATTRNDDRRCCFHKSDAASSAGKEKEGEEKEEEPNKQLKKVGPAGGASCGDGVGEASAVVLVRRRGNGNSNNSRTLIKYDREVLIQFSQSPHSRVPPTNFYLVHLNVPDIVAAAAATKAVIGGGSRSK